jgi:hypothetical protein
MERSFYMERLPYIDEHATAAGGSRADVWAALLRGLRGELAGGAPIARLLGCDPATASARFDGRVGDAIPGFRVVESEPGRRLALQGRHRFSRYRLTFVLADGQLRAQTHAAFPGLRGRLYRAAVIGTGGHRIATRLLLRRIAMRV